MPEETVYTIGHSTHSTERFLELLRASEIDCLIDVRSTPFSGIAPQFNQPTLQAELRKQGLLYAHFRQEFGARHSEPALLEADGRVDFDKLRATASFRNGIERLRKAL